MRQAHRTASTIAGIYTLVQGIIYTVFAIYGCAVFTCLATYPLTIDGNHKTNYLLYLAYFKGACDKNPGGVPGKEWSGEATSASRTYDFLIAYGIVSAIWIPTSTLLVVVSASRVKGSAAAWMYYPWIATAVILLIMDIAGGVWYGIDISKTLTANDFAKFVGSNVGPLTFNMDGITIVPSVIMTGIFLRGIVGFILNAIFLGIVCQACREVKKSFSTSAFIRGSAPKNIQKQLEKEELNKDDESVNEGRWVRVTEEVTLPRLVPPPPEKVIVPERNEPRHPGSPMADAPSPVIRRRPSLHRAGSSPVYDVQGNPTGETFPFPQDPNRRYPVDPPVRYTTERDRQAIEREMEWERQQERETDRELARLRELEREKQDREFQRLKNDDDKLSNQRPWSYVNPSELKLTPKYDHTRRPRFAPEVPPKPTIPPPDYAKPTDERSRWDPTNLSRSNSGYNDQRWNPRRAY